MALFKEFHVAMGEVENETQVAKDIPDFDALLKIEFNAV